MGKRKQPKDMTSEELAKHVFHPKVLRAAKALVKRLSAPAKPRKSAK